MKVANRTLVAIVVGWLGLPWSGRAAPEPSGLDFTQIDAYLAGEVQKKGRVGLSVAILTNGQLAFVKGYGKASLADNGPVGSETRFAIGSITKQFTAACALLLAQEGKLSVADKVSRYYPELTRADAITLLDLMHHTSGFPDYYPLDFVDRPMQQVISPDDLIGRYARGPLDFEPGTAWSYSNTGYVLLGQIIAKASHQPFADFLRKRLLEPLGMTHTSYEPKLDDEGLAKGYTRFALGAPEPALPEAAGWVGAAGALYSTPSDLAKWDLALAKGQVLNPEFARLLVTPAELSPGKTSGYACGLAVDQQGGRAVLLHSGAVSGFTAFNAVVPSTESAVVLFANADEGLGNLPNVLLRLLLQPEASVPKVAGRSASEVVKALWTQFQEGKLDRGQFSAEFNAYLSSERMAGVAERLKRFGALQSADVLRARERGGMEVTTTRLNFDQGALQVLMYRKPDGTIEQFFIDDP